MRSMEVFIFEPQAATMWHWTEGESGDPTQEVQMDLHEDQIAEAERLTCVLPANPTDASELARVFRTSGNAVSMEFAPMAGEPPSRMPARAGSLLRPSMKSGFRRRCNWCCEWWTAIRGVRRRFQASVTCRSRQTSIVSTSARAHQPALEGEQPVCNRRYRSTFRVVCEVKGHDGQTATPEKRRRRPAWWL